MATVQKMSELSDLARLRQSTRLDGFACLSDFHSGLYECDHVSPWTKSGANVDAEIMVVGQDWTSNKALDGPEPNLQIAELGFDPSFPTNRNLDDLLLRHLGRQRSECYLTNLFPFIKAGKASASIPVASLTLTARQFTLREIEIVHPKLVICLGLRTFVALMRAVGRRGSPKLAQAIKAPFWIEDVAVHCVAHTGAFGTNNRGRDQVELDWQHLAQKMTQY